MKPFAPYCVEAVYTNQRQTPRAFQSEQVLASQAPARKLCSASHHLLDVHRPLLQKASKEARDLKRVPRLAR